MLPLECVDRLAALFMLLQRALVLRGTEQSPR